MAWDDFITAARQGNLRDLEVEPVQTAPARPKTASARHPALTADQLVRQMQEVERRQQSDAWLRKQAFIDASQMQGGDPSGGGAPPMDPSMMGGGMPMDPSMMGGGMPMDPSMMGGAPPMDPSMMGGGMPMDPSMMGGGMPMDPSMMGGGMPMGGAPPMGMPPAQDPTVGPGGKKMKVEEILMKEFARLKELIHGLYTAMGLEIPLSVVDSKDMAAAILEREEKKRTEQQVQATIPGTNTAPIPPLPTKIGSVLPRQNGPQLGAYGIIGGQGPTVSDKTAAILRLLQSR